MPPIDPEDVPTAHDRIEAFLASMGLNHPRPEVIALTADASDRRYYRLLLPDARSLVVALHVGPITFATLPFARVGSLLARMGLPVPEVIGHSDALGIVALEDLGDVTLQAHLGGSSVTRQMGLYREAVELVVHLQREGRHYASSAELPYTLAFDVEKLGWELRFFVTHFLEAHRGARLTPGDRAQLDAEWIAIAGELAAEPRVLCHRDYHSRNLMVHRGRLHLIDFQDARLGPDTYDLVSLLRDSYVDIDEVEVDELVAHFLALTQKVESPAEFRRRFDLMSVQRNLKALGTFGFQATARGNRTYLRDVPRTLEHVRGNLERYDRFVRLHDLLAGHIEELR
ncbi:MAG: aminoglycoside phosphotransferase family protein [Vicinamibacterales bacterium]